MQRVNTIVLQPEYYTDNNELNDYKMWDDVSILLNILTKNNCVAVVKQDDFQNIFIEFETEDREMGDPYPWWLSQEELETVIWDDEICKSGDEE